MTSSQTFESFDQSSFLRLIVGKALPILFYNLSGSSLDKLPVGQLPFKGVDLAPNLFHFTVQPNLLGFKIDESGERNFQGNTTGHGLRRCPL